MIPGCSLPEWLGLRVVGEPGRHVTVVLEPRPECLNYRGSVHGGTLATLADVTMAIAASHDLPPQTIPVTAGLELHYVRPAFGPLRCEARLLAETSRKRIAQSTVRDERGREVLVGVGSFAIVPGEVAKTPMG